MTGQSNTYKIPLLLVLICIGMRIFAQQPVVITGEAPFACNEEIRLLVFDDLLNNIPTVAAHDKIDKNGRFKLSYATTDIKLVQLAIRTTKAEFFIVPFHSYHFHISADTVLFNLINPETYGGFLQITTDKTDTADLNYKINRFSRYFSGVTDRYAFRITYDHDPKAFDTVSTMLSERFPIRYNPENFYESYIYYTYGLLEILHDRRAVFSKYFDHDRVLYNNPAYMALFNQFYDNYLYISRHISKDLLARTINEQPDYLTLFNESGRDPQLVNERIRELVIIHNLDQWLDNEEFDRGNIVKLLQYIQVSTHFPEHQPFIVHALERVQPPAQKKDLPAFTNEKGKHVRLNQLGDKPIYVQILQSDCIDCIREMVLLNEFYQTFQDNVQFVSLCVDYDKKQYEKFCKTYGDKIGWPILHFNDNYDWLMLNEVETLPEYLMTSPQGKITNRYPPSPENGLLQYFYNTFPKEEKESENPLFRNNKQ